RWHGMYTPYEGTTIARSLSITFAREIRHVELDECADPGQVGKVSMHVMEPGASPLAVGTIVSEPGSAGTCVRLEATFPHAGSYSLEVIVAPDFLPAGDFYMRFY